MGELLDTQLQDDRKHFDDSRILINRWTIVSFKRAYNSLKNLHLTLLTYSCFRAVIQNSNVMAETSMDGFWPITQISSRYLFQVVKLLSVFQKFSLIKWRKGILFELLGYQRDVFLEADLGHSEIDDSLMVK